MRDRVLGVWPLKEWGESRIVLAVSGGPDSMMLLECLTQLAPDKDRLLVVHCNHALRGQESDADEAFVRDQCQVRGLECRVFRFDERQRGHSSEEQLRRVRYEYLSCAAMEWEADWIALGHNADDNLETFFQRLLRGTGTRGLRGIPIQRSVPLPNRNIVKLIRPLLDWERAEILSWLAENRIPFRLDSSNAESHYTRNRIRQSLIPVLDELGGKGWRKRAVSSISQLSAVQLDREEQARRFLETIALVPNDDTSPWEIRVEQFDDVGWPMIREILVEVWHRRNWPLREMSHRHWNRIDELIQRSKQSPHPQRTDLPGGLHVQIRKGVFQLSKKLMSDRDLQS
jgi:tRNA(Ile)-lysidine synthase